MRLSMDPLSLIRAYRQTTQILTTKQVCRVALVAHGSSLCPQIAPESRHSFGNLSVLPHFSNFSLATCCTQPTSAAPPKSWWKKIRFTRFFSATFFRSHPPSGCKYILWCYDDLFIPFRRLAVYESKFSATCRNNNSLGVLKSLCKPLTSRHIFSKQLGVQLDYRLSK